jgi:hypothetical protein
VNAPAYLDPALIAVLNETSLALQIVMTEALNAEMVRLNQQGLAAQVVNAAATSAVGLVLFSAITTLFEADQQAPVLGDVVQQVAGALAKKRLAEFEPVGGMVQ